MAAVLSDRVLVWTKCMFCQNSSSEKLVCPANSTRMAVGVGYVTLSVDLQGFREIGQLPDHLSELDIGENMAASLIRNKACWHKACRDKFNTTKLDRARKRIIYTESDVNLTESNISDTISCRPSPRKLKCLTRSSDVNMDRSRLSDSLCFFCDTCTQGSDNLRQAMTLEITERVHSCAVLLNDHALLAKLSSGDMVAIEAKYHPICLLNLYRKASRVEAAEKRSQFTFQSESFAFAEVISYIEDCRASNAVYKLSDLIDIYISQLNCISPNPNKQRPHATRFKERLLCNLPDLTAYNHGKEVLLTYKENVGLVLNQANNADADAIHLMRTAKLIRNEIFLNDFEFTGSFSGNCQREAVPQSLLSLVNMILSGPGNGTCDSKAAVSISQLITFNAVKQTRKCEPGQTISVKHATSQETPLPIYLGLKLHSVTRKRKLIDKCFDLGLCISYNRVIQLSCKLANRVCDKYNAEQLVCPPALRGNLFTIAAADNIDHNPSSSTARSSFHGTGISLFQFPSVNFSGLERNDFSSIRNESSNLSDATLPSSYTEVMPCCFPVSQPAVPKLDFILEQGILDVEDNNWLDTVCSGVENGTDSQIVSWASYHAEYSPLNESPLPISALLPLFDHRSSTAAMIRHCMVVVRDAVRHLNPGQTPVLTFDQPLYSLAKQIQWHWPAEFGENQFVILMGGLHLEMAVMKALGHWLDSSGWVQVISQAGIATSGTAESFIHASHIKRTRYAHSVTACTLYILQRRAYLLSIDDILQNESQSFDNWCLKKDSVSIQFKYWNSALKLELLLFRFVRSIRQGNFSMFVEAMKDVVPWFFALDHTNYARWVTVHLRDMLTISSSHPEIASEFQHGRFTISKTKHRFSSIAIDQAHEQLNAVIKGDGGAVGLTENEMALRRWVIAGPEVCRVISEFEHNVLDSNSDASHHEQTDSMQKSFREDVRNLLRVFEETGNPFMEASSEALVTLDTHILAHSSVAETVRNAEKTGILQLHQFVDERLLHQTKSILAPLPRNKFPLFSFKPATKSSRDILKLNQFKTDSELFSRLFIACQSRNGNLDEFFQHENQQCPPSLSQNGSLRLGSKSDLLDCLCKSVNTVAMKSVPDAEVVIFDGAAVVQMLRPQVCKTFQDYADMVVCPYLKTFFLTANRIDLVFDTYVSDSLKSATREKRGHGMRMHVSPSIKLPKNWSEFLRVDENKTELFHLLADSLTSREIPNKLLLATYDTEVKCSSFVDTTLIAPCTHEEADSRMLLHCHHAAEQGAKQIALRTVDTDVVVLAVSSFPDLNIDKLWIIFGVGKNVRVIPVHEIAASLGIDRTKSLPVFHAFTGCDTVSSFGGRGKKTAWDVWISYPNVTKAFMRLCSLGNDGIDDETFAILERFIVIMYDRACDALDVNSARKQLFTKKSRAFDSLPPTRDALLQHIKRTVHQSVHVWGQCFNKQPLIPNSGLWGWVRDTDKWVPLWMTIPEISKICTALIRCKCKKGCTVSRCKCVKANLLCTSLCQCDGKCERK
jgi:hypothetical protein